MTVDRVRAYARKTAKELTFAGIRPDSWLQGGGTREVTEKLWGFLPRTKTINVPVSASLEGWRVWSQPMTTVETPTGGKLGGGYTEQREIWLGSSGDLLSVHSIVDKWVPPWIQDSDLSDTLERVEIATDSDILLADLHYHHRPKPPRVNYKSGSGYYESHVGLRRSDRLSPGMRISQGLTALRKAKGTYVQRPQSRKH